MSFLENLYSNEYFVPVLFTVIAVLAILFIITLILAIRDSKKSDDSVIVTTPKDIDAFSKTEDNFVSTEYKAEDLILKEKEEVKDEVEKDNVIESIMPNESGFENVNIEQPVEVKDEVNVVAPSEDIILENNATQEEVKQAENDLDLIAATLLKEYKKETPSEENAVNDQFSSVFVSPDVLPNIVEENKEDVKTMPNFADIPAPQPVRVIDASTIIDSSKKENEVNINNIVNEQYNIRK